MPEVTFLRVLLIASAIWRLSSMLANEDGPFLLFKRLRAKARYLTDHNHFFRAFRFSNGLECEWCNSLWISFPLAAIWFLFGDWIVWIMMPFSLSTGVIFLKYAVNCLECLNEYLEKLRKDDIKVRTANEQRTLERLFDEAFGRVEAELIRDDPATESP